MFNTTFKAFLTLLVTLFVFPSTASAHFASGNGLVSGAIHPLLGLDHLLAMVAVGIISTQLGGKAIWTLPGTFIAAMVLGGLLAMLGVGLPFVETGIALSVLVLGIAIAFSKKFSMISAIVGVAFFALFHGHAHGSEMSSITNPAVYILGFVISTVLLHISGVLTGQYASKTKITIKLLKYSGLAITLAGTYFLFGF